MKRELMCFLVLDLGGGFAKCCHDMPKFGASTAKLINPMPRSIFPLGVVLLAMLAGCATQPPQVKPSPYHFWIPSGPASQSLSQVFDDGSTTYLLPKPGVPIMGVQVRMSNGQFIPASLSMNGPYYTFPGIYPVLHVETIGREFAIANPTQATPAVSTARAADPSQHQAARSQRQKSEQKADRNTVTIESLYRAAPQKMDARNEGGILTLRLVTLIGILPEDWTVYPAQNVDAHRMVAVYLDQTIEQAMHSVCQQMSLSCAIDPMKKTISLFQPTPGEAGANKPEGANRP
jgi:hypothetical protein